MINYKINLSISASILLLYSGQFVASGSDYRAQDKELTAPSSQCLALMNTAIPVESGSALPIAFGRDMQNYLAGYICDMVNPCRLARLSKAWHQLVLGRAFEAKAEQAIMAIPFSPTSPSARWLELKDLQILNSGILRYQPKGKAAIEVGLSKMSSSGDLVFPDELPDLYLCVTRSIETFVKPAADKTEKTLVLLLTLSELKKYAPQISSDTTFLENIRQADLSQNAVCTFIRHAGHDMALWGFRYTILKFREMRELTGFQIYKHEKVRCTGERACWGGACMRAMLFTSFVFEPKLDSIEALIPQISAPGFFARLKGRLSQIFTRDNK